MIPYAGFDPEEEPLAKRAAKRENNLCPKDHRFTKANTGWSTVDGKRYRYCRRCAQARARERYWANPAMREKKKADAKRHWHEVRKHQT
jgi:hypothetical protein